MSFIRIQYYSKFVFTFQMLSQIRDFCRLRVWACENFLLIWKNLSEENLKEKGLNDRQKHFIMFMKKAQ